MHYHENLTFAEPDGAKLQLGVVALAAGVGPFPCVVIVHGGWLYGTAVGS